MTLKFVRVRTAALVYFSKGSAWFPLDWTELLLLLLLLLLEDLNDESALVGRGGGGGGGFSQQPARCGDSAGRVRIRFATATFTNRRPLSWCRHEQRRHLYLEPGPRLQLSKWTGTSRTDGVESLALGKTFVFFWPTGLVLIGFPFFSRLSISFDWVRLLDKSSFGGGISSETKGV